MQRKLEIPTWRFFCHWLCRKENRAHCSSLMAPALVADRDTVQELASGIELLLYKDWSLFRC